MALTCSITLVISIYLYALIIIGEVSHTNINIASSLGAVILIVTNIPSFTLLLKRRQQLATSWPTLIATPIYNILYVIGAMRGVWSLIWQPHYWHKTSHGHHLYRAKEYD